MNNEKIIEYFKSTLPYCEGSLFQLNESILNVFEKQIPKKVNQEIYDNEECCERCPTCFTFVHGHWCHECGQLLDWS